MNHVRADDVIVPHSQFELICFYCTTVCQCIICCCHVSVYVSVSVHQGLKWFQKGAGSLPSISPFPLPPPLEVGPLKSSEGVWGSSVSSTDRSGQSPAARLFLVHYQPMWTHFGVFSELTFVKLQLLPLPRNFSHLRSIAYLTGPKSEEA